MAKAKSGDELSSEYTPFAARRSSLLATCRAASLCVSEAISGLKNRPLINIKHVRLHLEFEAVNARSQQDTLHLSERRHIPILPP